MATNHKAKFKKAIVKAKKLYKTGRYPKFSDAVKAAYNSLPGKTRSAKKTRAPKRARVSSTQKKEAGKKYRQSKSKVAISRKTGAVAIGSLSEINHQLSRAKHLRDYIENLSKIRPRRNIISYEIEKGRNELRAIKKHITQLKKSI